MAVVRTQYSLFLSQMILSIFVVDKSIFAIWTDILWTCIA